MCSRYVQGMEQFKFSPSTINYDRLEEKEIRTSFLQLSEGGGDSSDNITVETLLTVVYISPSPLSPRCRLTYS